MSASPLDVPSDIWSFIASHLTSQELRRLYPVNQALFDLSMAERYRHVCFCGDKRMKWLCKNIVERPVRDYVQTIEIKPWKIEEKAAEQWSWIYKWSILRLLTRRDDEWLRRAEEGRRSRKIKKAVKRISEAVKQLPNVREYNVRCQPGNCHPPLVQGLIPTLTNWKHSLTKLTLCVPPTMLHCLAPVKLDRLESLELFFWSRPTEDFRFTVIEPLVVFVNNLFSTLQSLSVTTTREAANIDLTPLFKGFGFFPHLRHLAFSMPYDGSSFSTLAPLLSFLGRHQMLQSLKLRTTATATRTPTSVEQREWIPRILESLDRSFNNIQEVNVALRPLKAPATSTALIRFLSIHGHNLSSLALTEDDNLSLVEVQGLLRSTASANFHHLESLALNVDHVSAELFTFLARTFPRLMHLKIGFMYFPQSPLLDTFRDKELQLCHPDWTLRRIDLLFIPAAAPQGLHILETVLREGIPSLETVAFPKKT